MSQLLNLVEKETEDVELIPEILPVDARLSISGPVSMLAGLFDKTVAVVPTKASIPNTEFVLLEAFDATTFETSYVQATATDGSRSVAVVEDGLTIDMTGSVLLPGKKVLEILKLAPEKTARITVMGATATIRSGRALWTIQTPVDDALPPLPDVSDIELHSIRKDTFLRALEAARKATASSTSRPSLMQAQVRLGAFWACDGARLHKAFMEDFPEGLKFTMPVKFMDDAIRALRTFEDEYFELGANDRTVVLRLGRDILMGQRVLLEFPDIEKLALQPALLNTETLVVEVSDLAKVIERVRVAADPDSAGVHLVLRPQKRGKDSIWTLTVRARDKANNTSQETFEVQYEGGSKAKEITVNHKHMLELLGCLESEKVVLKLGEKRAPVYVEDGNFVGLVNPMLISS